MAKCLLVLAWMHRPGAVCYQVQGNSFLFMANKFPPHWDSCCLFEESRRQGSNGETDNYCYLMDWYGETNNYYLMDWYGETDNCYLKDWNGETENKESDNCHHINWSVMEDRLLSHRHSHLCGSMAQSGIIMGVYCCYTGQSSGRARPQAGLEKNSGQLINNFGLNSTKLQNFGRRRLNKTPAGWRFKFG